jgi:phosphoribosyl 1,2-cyclic phosphodiesterase
MLDCGADWRAMVHRIAPSAIVVTHAHPDHVDGLKRGAPCPVYAPAAVWKTIERWPVHERYRLRSRVPTIVCGITVEAFPLEHSVIAPAVGYRVTAGGVTVFYAPDVLRIRYARQALRGIRSYIGDGATIIRPIVQVERRKGFKVGHASIATQLEWCATAGVTRAIFTHCGRAIVAARSRTVVATVSELGRVQGIDTMIAHDGFRLVLR